MKVRAVVLIRDGDRLLLMHRIKAGREYYVVPGGTVEEGETPEEAVVREAAEETGLAVVLQRKLCTLINQGSEEHYFFAASYSGKLRLGGPEVERLSEANQYRLEWVEASRLDAINLLPEAIRALCRACVE